MEKMATVGTKTMADDLREKADERAGSGRGKPVSLATGMSVSLANLFDGIMLVDGLDVSADRAICSGWCTGVLNSR